MAYLFRQKLNLLDLAGLPKPERVVLLVDFEDFLGSLYRNHLLNHNLKVEFAPTAEDGLEKVKTLRPDLLMLHVLPQTCESAVGFLKKVRFGFPALLVVTVGIDVDHNFLAKISKFGLSGHIDRRFSRPQDLATVVKALLKN